nr:hypothetical protein [Angustibacter aerolatus]
MMLLVGAAMFAMFYFLGLYIQQILGYRLAEGRLRVPAVRLRHRRSRPGRRRPRGPRRPALDLRHRRRPRRDRHVRLLASHRRVLVRRAPAAVHRRAVVRPRPGLRADDPHRRARRRPRGLRRRLRGAQHRAADRRHHRPGDAQHGRRHRRHQPGHRGSPPRAAPPARSRLAAMAQTYGYTRAFLVAAAMVLVGGLIVFIGLDVKHAEPQTDEAAPAHVG